MIGSRWMVGSALQSPMGCFMIGQVYHGDDPTCSTPRSVALPRIVPWWKPTSLVANAMCARGSSRESPTGVAWNAGDIAPSKDPPEHVSNRQWTANVPA
jgi:hypothetical protein